MKANSAMTAFTCFVKSGSKFS